MERLLENSIHRIYPIIIRFTNTTVFKKESGMHTVTIQGMSCQHCVASVTKALQAIPGVSRVDVDLSAGRANYDGEVNPAVVKEAITAIGFTVLDVK